MNENKTRVLMLAHVFPRALDDSMGAFLLHLANALVEQGAQIDVLAPHAAHLANVESFGAIRVWRFHYAPTRWERLAYAGTMHEFVARGIVNKILFAFFNLAFFLEAWFAVRSSQAHLLHAHERKEERDGRHRDDRGDDRGAPQGANARAAPPASTEARWPPR